jgi:teichuronic acid biosynthesis glycosyltransferase TuaC
MKLLLIASAYPYADHPYSGIFNERSARALQSLCDDLVVFAPHCIAPPIISVFMPRWRAHGAAARHEIRNGVCVYRPRYPLIPRVRQAFWHDWVAYLRCRGMAGKLHNRMPFGAILSFDLVGEGAMAWRLGRHLGIPAAGWVTGHVPALASHRNSVARALKNLDMVFYQSHELLEDSARLLGVAANQMRPDRHIVLPRGIPLPPSLPRNEIRNRIRAEWGLTEDSVLVLSIGRIVRDKGVFELIDSISAAVARDSRIACAMIGSHPAFDETDSVRLLLDHTPALKQHVRFLPACSPEMVWEYLCAADIFAFTSYHEGMPNSLLEAMAMGVPAVAFAIPPVLEIEAGTGALETVPHFDPALFAQSIVQLAASPDERTRLGERGKRRVMDAFQIEENMARAYQRLTQLVPRST